MRLIASWFFCNSNKKLGITPVNAFDAFNLRPGGEYKFRITPRNRYGWGEAVTMTSSVTVREIVKFPEFTNILPGQLKALRGELLHLECEVRSESKAEVKWYRDTTDIDALQDPRYMTHYSGTKCTMTVQSIKENDSGRYVCEATNPAGRVSTFARVQVVTDPKIVEADEKLRRMRYFFRFTFVLWLFGLAGNNFLFSHTYNFII